MFICMEKQYYIEIIKYKELRSTGNRDFFKGPWLVDIFLDL